MNRSQLLKRLDKAWEELEASYDGLSDSEMMEPGVMDTWSVRDIIAHVSWWEEEALMHLGSEGDVVESLYFRIYNLSKFDNRYLWLSLGK